MKLTFQLKHKIGDTVYWTEENKGSTSYACIFSGVIDSVQFDGSTVTYFSWTRSVEDMLNKKDMTAWLGGGGKKGEATEFFTSKDALLKASLPARLHRQQAFIEAQLSQARGSLTSLQQSLKEGPQKVKKLQAEVEKLEKEQAEVSKRLKQLQ